MLDLPSNRIIDPRFPHLHLAGKSCGIFNWRIR